MTPQHQTRRIRALPTTYNGVNYRSLLEARYAAWFGLMGIEAQYEPEAFAGYIPDFMGSWPDGGRFVIEIKGALDAFDLGKIRRSGWWGDAFILTSAGPRGVRGYIGDDEPQAVKDDPLSAPAPFGQLSLFLWACREYATIGGYRTPKELTTWAAIDAAWREAGNIVQWRGRGAR